MRNERYKSIEHRVFANKSDAFQALDWGGDVERQRKT